MRSACLALKNPVGCQPDVMQATHTRPNGSPRQPWRAHGVGGMKQVLLEMRDDLRRFALARRCDPAEVDDLLQDLFLKVDALASGPVGNPRAYLFQMTNNLLLDRRRGQQRAERRDDAWARSQYGQDVCVHPAASPEKVAIDRQQLARVEQALAQMPERTALILKRFRLEGRSQRQIADAEGISLSAVEKHLQRAYRALLVLHDEMEAEPRQEAE